MNKNCCFLKVVIWFAVRVFFPELPLAQLGTGQNVYGGGLEQIDGSSGFESLGKGGSFNFQIPMVGRSSYFITGIGTHLSANLQFRFY